jgi:protein TonB
MISPVNSLRQGCLSLGQLWRRLTPPRYQHDWALGITLGLHALVLSIQFVLPPAVQAIVKDTFLDVILVSTTHPSQAVTPQAMAQEDQQGGGHHTGQATTPIPTAHLTQAGQFQEKRAHRIQRLAQEQQLLLSKIHTQLRWLEASLEEENASSPSTQAIREEHRQLLQLVGQIEKRIEQNGEKSRWHTIGPSTQKRSYAAYYQGARQKIEAWGTAHFPSINNQKLYGDLIVALTVAVDGQLIEGRILQSSGQAALDEQALAIVRAAAPFGPFTAEMQQTATQLELVARFVFATDTTLKTQWKSNPNNP